MVGIATPGTAILKKLRDIVLWALVQELTPIFTGNLQPGSEVITALLAEPHWIVLALHNRHALPPVS